MTIKWPLKRSSVYGNFTPSTVGTGRRWRARGAGRLGTEAQAPLRTRTIQLERGMNPIKDCSLPQCCNPGHGGGCCVFTMAAPATRWTRCIRPRWQGSGAVRRHAAVVAQGINTDPKGGGVEVDTGSPAARRSLSLLTEEAQGWSVFSLC